MKYLTTFLISISFSLSTFACSCALEQSFCNYINTDYFKDRGGIVCIVEATDNSDYWNQEFKIIELLFGEIQSGVQGFFNTDSTIWIMAGTTSCNEGVYGANYPGEQFVIAPIYQGFFGDLGYQLFLCAHDEFKYSETMLGPIITDLFLYPYDVWEIDTIKATQLPQIVDECTTCILNLNLSGYNDFPNVYQAGLTITSNATVFANVLYKAGNRIRLESGFRTDQAISFGVSIEGCN